ncbi:MAG: PurR6 [Paenibacillaceae bacterium]|nr:PurR6 [Paenibacillaceae bacterium]
MSSKIYDIARRAGVSPATVSLALNGRPGVSAATKAKVLEIAKELDYVPNRLAQGLQGGRSNNILVFMSGPQYDYFTSPFYFETLKHLSRGLEETPYQMLLQIATVDQERSKLKSAAAGKGYDAVIFIGLRMPVEEARSIIGERTVCLFINRPLGESIYSINANYVRGAYLLTRHLLELGHRDIGLVGYIPKLASAEMRLKGYRQALEEAGVPFLEERLYYSEYFQEAGYMAMRKLLQGSSGGPTGMPGALIGGNDLIAIGMLECAWEAGIRVPDELSLAGMDNLSNTHLLRVPLTTVQVRHDLIGYEASKTVQRLLSGDESVAREQWIDVHLIIRDSTGPVMTP